MSLTLAKIVAINGKRTLSDNFSENYFPEIDMYLFFSEAKYDPTTGSYSGIRKLHDRIISEERLPTLSNQDMNYVSVDIKSSDKTHTYLTCNRRCYQLTTNQKEYIAKIFEADFY